MSRSHEPQRSSLFPFETQVAFEVALTRAAAAARGADVELVDAVHAMDEAGRSETALRFLFVRPRMVLRLDEAIRRTSEYRYQRHRTDVDQPVPAEEAGPLGVALDSSHLDGRVRERAVLGLHALLRQPQPPIELLPFLVLRTADWAGPVRDRARAALSLLLHDEPNSLVLAAAAVTLLIARRERGSFARQQLVSALMSSPGTAVFDQLLASPEAQVRRFALETALTSQRLPLSTLVAVTKKDTDRRCRGLAAEGAIREAVWTERTDLLRQLASSGHQEVRVLALVGFLRRGLASEVTPHLGDTSALVRAVARDAARRTGSDALGWYRTAIRTPTPGGIAGLAETGRKEDSALLTPLLSHPHAPIRAAAVRGLRSMEATPIEQTIPLLRDPSTKVIREATASLRSRADRLPSGLAQCLLADHERAAVRRAGYRLLNEPDPVQRLRTALTVATDSDPGLARWGVGEVATLLRGFHSPVRRFRTTRSVVDFEVTVDEQGELLALAGRAAPRLPHGTLQFLHELIDTAAPSTELLRVRYGPHPETANRLLDVEATFIAEDPSESVALMREVLIAVLPYAAGPADQWPTDEEWMEILPEWFVQRCAPEPEAPLREGSKTDWLAWWRGLTRHQREIEMRTNAVADWRLTEWINFFDPDGTASNRSWSWWDGGVSGRSTGWVRFGTDGHPYGGGGALRWLIEAAGGYDIELP